MRTVKAETIKAESKNGPAIFMPICSRPPYRSQTISAGGFPFQMNKFPKKTSMSMETKTFKKGNQCKPSAYAVQNATHGWDISGIQVTNGSVGLVAQYLASSLESSKISALPAENSHNFRVLYHTRTHLEMKYIVIRSQIAFRNASQTRQDSLGRANSALPTLTHGLIFLAPKFTFAKTVHFHA